jgi:polyketide biosynthesis enoyl-CoA hydratase PksH
VELTPDLPSAATVRLPERLSVGTLEALTAAIDDALASPAAVVVFAGATDETYCLGLALDTCGDPDFPTAGFAALLGRLHGAPKPLLACVDGRAIGGGMGLAAACDWVIATERSTFALPELLWGLVPGIIWPVLADRMAPQALRQWTIAAHTRSAAEAHAAGMVDTLVPPSQLASAERRAIRSLRRLDAPALVQLRAWHRESRALDLPAALQRGAAITAGLARQPHARDRWLAYEGGEAPWSN